MGSLQNFIPDRMGPFLNLFVLFAIFFMNFFEQQDRARKRTGLLVLLFSLAVLCLVFVRSFLHPY